MSEQEQLKLAVELDAASMRGVQSGWNMGVEYGYQSAKAEFYRGSEIGREAQEIASRISAKATARKQATWALITEARALLEGEPK